MPAKTYSAVENKLLILYLINRMEISLSLALITDIVIGNDFMDHFTLGETLADMVDQDLLSLEREDANTSRYTVTDHGLETLELFNDHLSRPLRNKINQYIEEHRGKIKREFESSVNYFPNAENNEFQVKCGVYEDKRVVLELVLSVDTREQAKLIQANWRLNPSAIYQKIIEAISITPEVEENENE